jgi:Tol biopolymer transport system component
VRFVIDAPDKTTFVTAGRIGTSAAISPDGSRVAFTARDSTGKVQLWLRKLDDVMPQVVPGTDGANFPFWSPDSRSIGYFAAAGLQRIDLSSGSSQTVCSITGTARGGTWSPTGVIVFGIAGGSLWRVAATGGKPMALPASRYQPDNRFPSFLPDGRHFLFSGGAEASDLGQHDGRGICAWRLPIVCARRRPLRPGDRPDDV